MAILVQTQADREIRGKRAYRPVAEINVTPFVDVMLVLLIVFMVTAPLLTVGVPVNLPKTSGEPISAQSEPLVISVTENGDIYLQEQQVDMSDLVSLLTGITGANPDVRIFVRGDESIAYGVVMEVIGTVNAAGFTRVALVAEPLTTGTQ
ncbi:MAG: protein TolR [Pseudomonadota bacterium]